MQNVASLDDYFNVEHLLENKYWQLHFLLYCTKRTQKSLPIYFQIFRWFDDVFDVNAFMSDF